ncbi:ABC-F family ATP-binding cassette domain-containing protein [Clostridium sp. MSJ-4]|uniref:ABC-F family ATP-binding cassette domain-containing protein n=1 Tax=Clostridium simiarum TaxID=2841506 RepID=A0ABS6F339_9CLOT|nr:ABC-F family ATP-binding cassette domain-containing protein [Clostridium simiarum]MBU5592919.1 ABC-F family ATP-binding cassette domain-containing protein [Clostridium simiarum]
MIVIGCKDVHKSYGIDVILDKITFSINEGDKVGFIGANGAGKSTLFKILTGELSQDSGDVFIDKNKTLGYLSQHLSLESYNSIYDEMLSVFSDILNMEERLRELEIKLNEPYDPNKAAYHDKLIKEYTTLTDLYNNKGGYVYKGDINRVLKGLGFLEEDYNKPIRVLSGGQKTRVALCKLLLTKPEILLLDEPTNHLDLEAIEWLEEYLKAYKGTIIIISHDRFFLDAITTHTFELINGHVDCYNASYSKYIDLRKKEFETKLKAYNLQQSEIKRQEDIIERYRSFNREKSIRAAESREKALAKIERLEAPDKDPKASKIKFETLVKSGNDVLHVEDLSKSFGENKLFEQVNFDVKRGERIALIGENGRGKTTLFNIIMDKLPSDRGIKVLGKNVFIGYYDQEQSDLHEEKTIIDEIWDDYPDMTTTQVRNALASFLFTGDDVFKDISKLSGGEKCRINLLKLMLSKANFLLLDEPTNHLDIMSREALEEAISGYDGTIIVISHDRYFLNKVIDKIFELNSDGIKEYLGNYTYFQEKKKNPQRYEGLEELQNKSKTQIAEERRKKREADKKAKDEVKRVKSIEEKIATIESNIVELQELLCLEEVYSNPEKSESIHREISELEQNVEDLYKQWEKLI